MADTASAAHSGQAQIHDPAPDNTVYNWHLGDKAATDAAFAAAKHVTKLDFVNNRLIPNPMEPRAAVGDYDSGTDTITLYTTSQNPHVARLVLSAFIGLAPEHKLRVIAPDVGGGFGSKIFIYAEETVCAWAAKKIDRPSNGLRIERKRSCRTRTVVTMSRTPSWRSTRRQDHRLARAHDRQSWRLSLDILFGRADLSVRALLSGQYNIPSIYSEIDAVYTNTAPVDAYRGAGRPEATFVVERLVEVAARETGRDPAEFRRKNFITTFPHQTPVVMAYDAGDYPKRSTRRWRSPITRACRRARPLRPPKASCAASDLRLHRGLRRRALGGGRLARRRRRPLGIGGGARQSDRHGRGSDGLAQSRSGPRDDLRSARLGRLGIPMENVSIVHGDTDKVQMGMGTYGSRSGAVGMSAIFKALDKIEAKAKKVAGHVLEASEQDIEFKDGKFTVKGTDKSIDFGSVALQAYIAHKFNGQELEPGLKESAFWDPTNFTFPAGVHICELEIDPQTGVVTIDRWTAVDDFGKLINPMIVEGQVHGGIAQGVGQALLEGAHYDDDGQLLTASFMDYCMPRADNLPSFKVETIETVCPSNPLGIKGCGEAGAIASPPAVINAITDALGHEDVAMPATPQVVWRAAQKTMMKRAAE